MSNALKMAVPVHVNRISPLFDTSTTLLVAMIMDGLEKERRLFDIKTQSALARPKYLENLGVNVLICGAISGCLHRQVEFLNIQVISCIAGEVADVIAAYIEERLLQEPSFMMPGCAGQKSRHSSGGGGGFRFFTSLTQGALYKNLN